MKKILNLVIYGEPKPWSAPQVNLTRAIYSAIDMFKKGVPVKQIVAVLLKSTKFYASHRKYKKEMVRQIEKQLPADWQLLDKPLGRELKHFCKLPKSREKQGFKLGDYKPQRPDDINLDKLVEDAMTGLVYRDDNILVCRPGDDFKKFGDPPRTEITIYEM